MGDTVIQKPVAIPNQPGAWTKISHRFQIIMVCQFSECVISEPIFIWTFHLVRLTWRRDRGGCCWYSPGKSFPTLRPIKKTLRPNNSSVESYFDKHLSSNCILLLILTQKGFPVGKSPPLWPKNVVTIRSNFIGSKEIYRSTTIVASPAWDKETFIPTFNKDDLNVF